jgi:hypothetical protein
MAWLGFFCGNVWDDRTLPGVYYDLMMARMVVVMCAVWSG